ncbi:MAG: hypothetical protein FWE84_02440 [Firmicutes bacterium]|nr:hypothetical protein [Bacillota bacterium]
MLNPCITNQSQLTANGGCLTAESNTVTVCIRSACRPCCRDSCLRCRLCCLIKLLCCR